MILGRKRLYCTRFDRHSVSLKENEQGSGVEVLLVSPQEEFDAASFVVGEAYEIGIAHRPDPRLYLGGSSSGPDEPGPGMRMFEPPSLDAEQDRQPPSPMERPMDIERAQERRIPRRVLDPTSPETGDGTIVLAGQEEPTDYGQSLFDNIGLTRHDMGRDPDGDSAFLEARDLTERESGKAHRVTARDIC